MQKLNNFKAVATALLFSLSTVVHAGQSCEGSELEPLELMNALELALKTQTALQQAKAETAVIARVGQNLSPYGLRYSHLGLVQKQSDGRYTVLHELNECGSDLSELYVEGLGNFFLDDVYAFEVLILIPPQQVQQKLNTLMHGSQARQVHHKKYSMLSYAFATDYQNSNQWGLELLAHALSEKPLSDRTSVQRWLKQQSYQPGVIAVDPLKRLGASVFKANVSFDDHPLKNRLKGQYQVVTVESVEQFLLQQQPKTQRMVLTQ
jgi:hypothetical protein